jgi:hypothetical protein
MKNILYKHKLVSFEMSNSGFTPAIVFGNKTIVARFKQKYREET